MESEGDSWGNSLGLGYCWGVPRPMGSIVKIIGLGTENILQNNEQLLDSDCLLFVWTTKGRVVKGAIFLGLCLTH